MDEHTTLLREILVELKTLNNQISSMQARGQEQLRQARENMERMKNSLPPEMRDMLGGVINGL